MATSVTVRMYNQLNLGDCFLLQFDENGKKLFILLDFGSYEKGNEEREIEIAENIRSVVKKQPIIFVLTHQHQDHLSGYISAESILKKLNIVDVWFSYLDDPTGTEAELMRNATEQFWKKNKELKKKTKIKFGKEKTVKKMLEAKEAMDLFAEEQTGGQAITNLLEWSKQSPQFLVPGKILSLPGIRKESVKIYVLGPPTDPKLLRKMDPSMGDAVVNLNAFGGLMNLDISSNLMLDALGAVMPGKDSVITENFPFNKKFTRQVNDPRCNKEVKKKYFDADPWRKIDHEWLSEVGRISLHMARLTNNSSLVLAVELVEKQKVLLFAADAQIGNWKSWKTVKFTDTDVDAVDLLSRTVLYKAGHHSSDNATWLESLNRMKEKDLVIMIPVNEEVSNNRHFAMLHQGMLKGYNRKSEGRVLRSDTIYHKPKSVKPFKHTFATKPGDFKPAIKVQKDKSGKQHLFVEYTVK